MSTKRSIRTMMSEVDNKNIALTSERNQMVLFYDI
jgi:hypothetical protein